MSDSFYGLYSNSGFDLLAVLSKISSRKNPTIDLGPIDHSCSFVVSDALKEDFPIVYVSSTFESLTGYKAEEILGKNCRFLQAPGGQVKKGEKRNFADTRVVYQMKKHIETAKECQFLNVNFKKSGEPFVNLITVIPVSLDEKSGTVTHFVGFQVDLLEQSHSILNRLSDDKYVVNYNNQTLENLPDYIIETYGSKSETQKYPIQFPSLTQAPVKKTPSMIEISDIGFSESVSTVLDSVFPEQDINESVDFIHILSSRGLILFVSESFRNDYLQYESRELIGKSISEFCHHGDFGSLMKELKGSNLGETISTMYRFKTKYFGYIWLDVSGKKFEIPNSKKIKCFVLSGRLQQRGTLPHRMLVDNLVFLDHPSDLWIKITYYGLILFASTACSYNPFGTMNSNLFGTSIYEYLLPKSISDLKIALDKATINCPILHSVTSNSGEQLALCLFPCASFIYVRIKSVSIDSDCKGDSVTPDVIYPSNALYVDIFLPITESSSLGYQFEMKKLHASNRNLELEIQRVLSDGYIEKKRKGL